MRTNDSGVRRWLRRTRWGASSFVAPARSRNLPFIGAPLIALALIGLSQPGLAGPPAVEYVKVCSIYGSGFFNISGSDVCMRISAGAQAGYASATTTFEVDPAFNVGGSSFVYNVNAMALFSIPATTSTSAGARLGYLGGNMGGSTFYPSSGGTYAVDTKGIVAVDLLAQFALRSQSGDGIWGTT
jgi:hypothetical protein